MNLADIYLKTDVTKTTIEMRQTKWEQGLYDKEGSSVDGYIQTLDPQTQQQITTHNISTWTFDGDGKLASSEDNEKTILSKDDYFVPIDSD